MGGADDRLARRAATAAAWAVRLGPLDVAVERRPDGTIYRQHRSALPAYPDRLTERLRHWAERAPERIFLAEREPRGAWRRAHLCARRWTRCAASAARCSSAGCRPERPLVILSGNDIEHALLALAALYVGIPYVPMSPAYSLMSSDFGKLRHIVELITPGLVFAADGDRFGRAIEAAIPADVEIVVGRNRPPGRRTTPFSALLGDGGTAPRSTRAHARSGRTRSRRSFSPRARPACPRA